MRMWQVPPYTLCRQHFLGYHRELHTMWRSIELGKNHLIFGHTKLNQIDVSKILSEHEACEREMIRRKYNHKSPMPEHAATVIQEFIDVHGVVPVDVEFSLQDLRERCPECAKLQKEYGVI